MLLPEPPEPPDPHPESNNPKKTNVIEQVSVCDRTDKGKYLLTMSTAS